MEKIEIEKEAQHLKRLPRQDPHARIVSSTTMSKINKDAITKFEAMEKILKNLDDKVTEVGSSIRARDASGTTCRAPDG
jgi:hypothetical protein